ncbi:MAG TPA: peptidoglycan-associated lipoprotein Pal [Vicinamibacterales bacterium]|nr:peptidoglycan-associated lipoprotein Pal [Vicinamibacterales bacterium]
MTRMRTMGIVLVTVLLALALGCAKKPGAVPRPMPPPGATSGNELGTTPPPPAPEPPLAEPAIEMPTVAPENAIGSKNLDELNRESPFAPVFFALDSFDISAEGSAILQASARVLQRQPTWQLTIEGHCDERGTAEYNLSLGERRAVAAETYLVSLGIAAERLRTVSYGKEFPFDPGHDESAWSKNRRAHFVITAK